MAGIFSAGDVRFILLVVVLPLSLVFLWLPEEAAGSFDTSSLLLGDAFPYKFDIGSGKSLQHFMDHRLALYDNIDPMLCSLSQNSEEGNAVFLLCCCGGHFWLAKVAYFSLPSTKVEMS